MKGKKEIYRYNGYLYTIRSYH